ncbi:MAG: TrbG/VirB9 family P-type conjugative transfer protein [Acidobacteria bacterium]|nr:TrbG/VirB9 family P-type conjugative transfer protein [Acidobacteriota bacterium]
MKAPTTRCRRSGTRGTTRCGGWAGGLALALAAAVPAAGQDLRAPAAPSDAPVTVTTRVRHVTIVVLPETESIVDVVVGDAEYWDVSSAAHLAFIRPLVEDARSNLVLLTAAGAVVPLLVVEQAAAAVDAVVRIKPPGQGPAPETAASGPVLATAERVTEMAARAAAAWEETAEAEVRASERVEAARTVATEALDTRREAYPRQLQFDYRWAFDAEPQNHPWLVEGLWHDGQRTYLRTRATSPVLYEQVDGVLEPVAVAAVLDDVLHVVPRVLGAGALAADGRRIAWTVERREAGP